MAAQEYYGASMPILQGPPTGPFPLPQQNGTLPPRPQNQQQQQQPPQPTRPSTSNGQAPPYPLSDTPPPAYSAFNPQQQPPPRASSQPPPQNYQPYRPNVDTHQYPPEKLSVPQRPSTLQNMSRPSDYAAQYPPPSQPQYQPPPVQPPNGMYQQVGPGLGSLSQVYGSQHPPRRSSTSGASPYRRDSRSRSRSRDSRDRKHRRHHHNARPPVQRQKSSGVNTFLGAGGGAIVGDLIFPGLGTLGGALLGGVGGHEYGKKRPQSNPARGQRRKGETYEEEYRRGRK